MGSRPWRFESSQPHSSQGAEGTGWRARYLCDTHKYLATSPSNCGRLRASRAPPRPAPPRRGYARRACASRRTDGCGPCPATGREPLPVRRRWRGAAADRTSCSRGVNGSRLRDRAAAARPGSTTRSPPRRGGSPGELAGRGVLQQEPCDTALHRPAQIARAAKGGQDQHPAFGQLAPRDPRPHRARSRPASRCRAARCPAADRAAASTSSPRAPGRPPRCRPPVRAGWPARRGPCPGPRRCRTRISARHGNGSTGQRGNPARGRPSRPPPAPVEPALPPGLTVGPPDQAEGADRSRRLTDPGTAAARAVVHDLNGGIARSAVPARAVRAPLWRITLVAPSRTAHARTASTPGRADRRALEVGLDPAAESATRAPSNSPPGSAAGSR